MAPNNPITEQSIIVYPVVKFGTWIHPVRNNAPLGFESQRLEFLTGWTKPLLREGCHEINVILWINPRVAFRRYPKNLETTFLWEHTVDSIVSLCNNGVKISKT